jgi:hypothetical protein
MSSAEKKVAAVLGIIFVALIAGYLVTGRSAQTPGASAAMGAQVCAPTGPIGGGVETQEFGEEGAEVEIVAALPITHGCHVQTEAELKKAYEKHPDDIRLVIYDLFGPEGQEFVAQHGGMRAVVFINGKTTFELNGRPVKLEVIEGGTYVPADIVPIIEQELAKAG